MAFRPSMKKKATFPQIELNITPVMNLMVVLIPILLIQSAAIKLAIHEVNLPSTSAQTTAPPAEKEKKVEKKLELTVFIEEDGFHIISAFGKEKEGEPTIPLKDNEYDYEGLTNKLIEIKEKMGESKVVFSDSTNVIIIGKPETKYDIIIKVMDSSKWYEQEGEGELTKRLKLFPDTLLSPGRISG